MKSLKGREQTLNKGTMIKLFFGAIALCALVWALVSAFTPSSNLEPYDKFKKNDAPAETSKNTGTDSLGADADASSSLAEASLTPEERAIKGRIRQVAENIMSTPVPAPPALVSREALEHLSKGMQFSEQNKFGSAELEFEKAAAVSPNSPEVFAIWATALRMQGKFKGANRRFAKALELAPNDDEILFNWGMSRLMEKNSDEAIKLFQQTIQLQPEHYLAYSRLGKAYGQKKMYAEEEASYRKALEIKPDFGRVHFNLGIVLSLQKKYNPAADHFEKAIAIDKEFEKPFVVQLLTAMGRKTDMKTAKLREKDGTKAETSVAPEATKEEAYEPEGSGSGHQMEGSDKITKPITKVTGKVTINGQMGGPNGLIMLETKTKLKAPGQKILQVSIFQKNLAFLPQHTIVPVGSTVNFVNNDVEVHNIFSKSLNNQFNLGAMAAGTSKGIKMTSPGPVILRCNLHKDMVGTLFVAPNGYYAKVDAQGNFAFDEVKSAEYIMQFWHPRLYPEEVEAHAESISLTGEDKVLDIKIESASKADEIHDLIDATDYNLIADNIEKEMRQAIIDWKNGKKFISRKRMLMAITKHYDGEGLKGAIARSFSVNRSEKLEQHLDSVRKKISGIDKSQAVTEAGLTAQADKIMAQLRNNVSELENRLKPAQPETSQ